MFSTMGSLHPRMPGTIDNEMPLLGNGNMHWVTIRRDASEMSRPAVAALLRRRGGPGKKEEKEEEEEEEKKNKKNKKKRFSFGFGWFVSPPSVNESADTPPPGEAAGQLPQGFQVIRGARMATLCSSGSGSPGEDAETEKKSETRKGKLLSIVPRALDFIRRKCGARRKAPPSSGGGSVDDGQRASHNEEQARLVQGSRGQTSTVYPVSGGTLTTTDWQLRQAKDNMGLPTPARSEVTLVDGSVGGSSARRRSVFPEAWWVYGG